MFRRVMAGAIAVAATFAVSVVPVGAGGATKAVAPGPWLTNVCKTYAQMAKAVDAAGNAGQLAYANANQTDGAALQLIFQTRFQAQDAAVSSALKSVKQAGTPSIANGKQLEATAVSTLTAFHSNLQKALQQLPAVAANPSSATQLYATAYPTNLPTAAGLVQTLVKSNKAFSDAALSGRGSIYKATTNCT
jgi:hypothetical protein